MKNIIKSLFTYTEPERKRVFSIEKEETDIEYDYREEKKPEKKFIISKNLDENLSYIKERFSIPKNNDVMIRDIRLKDNRRAFVLFIDGMVETQSLNQDIIKTLQTIPYFCDEDTGRLREDILERFISHSQAMITEDIDTAVEEVNFGSCAVFIDGFSQCISLDIRNWGHRSIDKPEIEQSIYGPQEAFAEMIRNNTALIRKIIKTEKLIAEGVKIGNVSKTKGLILYISDIANEKLVNEVRRRVNGINTDYIVAIEEVSNFIEDNGLFNTSQIMSTERPDRAARALIEGRVVLMLNGSPRVLVLPTNAFELTHAASDEYLKVPYANMTRIIRLIGMTLSVLLPGLYLAATLHHQEIIPTYLLYSISAARENVPFPSILELLLMDISFELIREAGIRMPGPLGSTLSIVGGLILGQAAVSAKIVSPIMIIIIAITGIGSFSMSNYSLSWSYRVLRVVFIILAAFLGFYGVAAGIFIYSLYIANQSSFGIPYLSPIFGSYKNSMSGNIAVTPIWNQQKRPGFLRTKKRNNEPKISRDWNIRNK